jgi:hypothetical protein
MELDKNRRFSPKGNKVELFNLDEAKHGWERFGDNHSSAMEGYMEGAWMTKHDGKYYLQYAAPGTEFNVYGGGVYTADQPLGPYTYAPNNPVFYKPGGFINGAGHGSTVQGPGGQYWHFASMAVSVNVNWERRLCVFPTWFDQDGLMYSKPLLVIIRTMHPQFQENRVSLQDGCFYLIKNQLWLPPQWILSWQVGLLMKMLNLFGWLNPMTINNGCKLI